MTSARTPAISVVLTTADRAGLLAATLEAFCSIDVTGLDVHYTIVDNNSSDDTSGVIRSFEGRLPLTHLFEARPGKACALNCALRALDPGDLLVFTDDDVVPDRDWLRALWDAGERWPDVPVFGGRVIPRFPPNAPAWVTEFTDWHHLFFSQYEPADEEGIVEVAPCGPNMAVRSSELTGREMDERYGPVAGRSYHMGSEHSVFQLVRGHMRRVYVPSAVVHHVVQAHQLEFRYLFRRAHSNARSATKRFPKPVRWTSLLARCVVKLPLWSIRHLAGRWSSDVTRIKQGCTYFYFLGELRELLALRWARGLQALGRGATHEAGPPREGQESTP